jgi:hypothetical protein
MLNIPAQDMTLIQKARSVADVQDTVVQNKHRSRLLRNIIKLKH